MRLQRILCGAFIATLLASPSHHAAGAETNAPEVLTAATFQAYADRLAKLATTHEVYLFARLESEVRQLKVVPREKDPAEFLKQRERKARLVLRTLSVLHSNFDPQFRPDYFPSSSYMPSGFTFASEVDSEYIKDPERRRVYAEGLRKHREEARNINKQMHVRHTYSHWPSNAIYYFVRTTFDMNLKEDRQEWERLVREEIKAAEPLKFLNDKFKEMDEKYILVQGTLLDRPQPPAAPLKTK